MATAPAKTEGFTWVELVLYRDFNPKANPAPRAPNILASGKSCQYLGFKTQVFTECKQATEQGNTKRALGPLEIAMHF